MSSKPSRARSKSRLAQSTGPFPAEPCKKPTRPFRRILTVTDHEMCRDWLASIIRREPDLAVCAEGGELIAAATLAAAEAPCLIILQSPLHGVHSFELLRELRKHSGNSPIIVFGDTVSGALAEAAIRAGARGYIHRGETRTSVIVGIRRVLEGGVYVSAANTDAMLRRMCVVESGSMACESEALSAREREVLRFLGSGYRPSAIASQMRVSIRTVESYTNRIRQKFKIESSSELVLAAVAWMRSQPA